MNTGKTLFAQLMDFLSMAATPDFHARIRLHRYIRPGDHRVRTGFFPAPTKQYRSPWPSPS